MDVSQTGVAYTSAIYVRICCTHGCLMQLESISEDEWIKKWRDMQHAKPCPWLC